MKIPAYFTALILITGSGFAWFQHSHLRHLKSELAVQTNLTKQHANASNRSSQSRANLRKEAEELADIFIGIARKGPDSEMDIAYKQRVLDITTQVGAMGSASKFFIRKIYAAQDIDPALRMDVIRFPINELTRKYPSVYLQMVHQEIETMGIGPFTEYNIRLSVQNLAVDDLEGAKKWLTQHMDELPEQVTGNAKLGLIFTAAKSNPSLAFKWMDELEIDASDCMQSIALTDQSPEQRSNLLASFRNYTQDIQNSEKRSEVMKSAFPLFAQSATKDGFEKGSRWLEASNFSEGEMELAIYGIADGINSNRLKSEEIAQWVTWFGAHVTQLKDENGIRQMMRKWLIKDYEAAGNWLSNCPAEFSLKAPMVQTYATSMAKIDPETAFEWVATLPAQRAKECVWEIFQDWQKRDKTSADHWRESLADGSHLAKVLRAAEEADRNGNGKTPLRVEVGF
ncbi:hypothetical protein JIN85_17310 [Luteolibacter pohnpeiensis]|uniref:Uncharacterized protein n=1 Tax=Luteolibacter pohnpeiensis TaxID=454153 RepID=A0A934VSD5_9BACT|nr:hypothetical protein [Luteolibacter pohnpeiensis]MBK1884181.1 hypothetical protein [Luteolibacter pohnpeiensis]